MRLKGKYWPVVCLLLFLVSCGQKSKNNTQAVGVAVSTSDSSRSILPEYAEGFEVQYVEGGCLVTIQDPQKEKVRGKFISMRLSGIRKPLRKIKYPLIM